MTIGIIDQKVSMMSTHLPPDGKELKIDGLMTNQNVQSTKNSVVKIIKNGGVKSETSEASDQGSNLKSNLMSHSSFKNGDRNNQKYTPLYKPMGSELSEERSR